jgi:hypothetical protein
MSDKLLLNAEIGISDVETAWNTPKTLAADYDRARTNALNITIPGVEKLFDKGLIGSGDEFATEAVPDYMRHTGITFSDRLNVTQMAKLIAGGLSGDITDTVVTAAASWDHKVEWKAGSLDPQLKSRTIAFKLGGLDFMLPGMVVNGINISAQGGSAPTYQIEMVGSGDFEYMADQTPALVLPASIAQRYVGQRSQVAVEFNDGTVFDLGAVGRLDSFNMQFSNNLITNERKLGDPLQNAADNNTGAIPRQLTRGERTATASIGMYVGDDKRGYLAHLANTEIASLKFKATSHNFITGTDKYEAEIVFPKAVITLPDLGGDRKGIMTLNIEPVIASGEDGLFYMRFRDDVATLV